MFILLGILVLLLVIGRWYSRARFSSPGSTIIKDLQKYPFYYINLDRSNERRKTMARTYKKWGLSHARIAGIDGQQQTLPYISTELSTLKNTEVACFLSHLKAIIQAYYDGGEIAIIQEDDTSFELLPYWITSLTEIIHLAPKDWEILHISSFWEQPSEWSGHLSFEKWQGQVIASTYVINRKGMERFLRACEWTQDGRVKLPARGCSIHEPIDVCLYKLCKTYIPNTILFVPYKSVSDIHGKINTSMEKEKEAVKRVRQDFNKSKSRK